MYRGLALTHGQEAARFLQGTFIAPPGPLSRESPRARAAVRALLAWHFE
jgi:hypothetical protein